MLAAVREFPGALKFADPGLRACCWVKMLGLFGFNKGSGTLWPEMDFRGVQSRPLTSERPVATDSEEVSRPLRHARSAYGLLLGAFELEYHQRHS